MKRVMKSLVCGLGFFVSGLTLTAASAAEKPMSDTLKQVLTSDAKRNKISLQSLQLALDNAGSRLVSVGERGVVLLSDDNGESWRQAEKVPVSVTLTSVSFADENNGWAAGHSGIIIHTVDGGETWEAQLNGAEAAELAMAEALKIIENDEEAGEDAKRNAGYLVKEGADKPLLAIHFANDKRGWAVGAYGLALATDDGGQHWYSIIGRLPNDMGSHLYQVLEKDNELLIIGERSAVFASDDSGKAFKRVNTPYIGSYFDGLLLENGATLLYGLRGNIWLQPADGRAWQHIDTGMEVTLTSGVVSPDDTILLADQSGQIYRSADNGAHFDLIGQTPFGGITDFIATDSGFAVSTSRGTHVLKLENLVQGGSRK